MPDGSKPDRAKKNLKIRIDGEESPSFSLDDLEWAAAVANGARVPLKESEEDRRVVEKVCRATAAELRSFIERFEALQEEKQVIAETQKEVMAEAKGRGYDAKILRRIIALRKREPSDVAAEEAVLEMYKQALGM